MSGALDLTSVTTVLGRFFRAVDAQDWPVVSGILADPVATDYTSVFGGTPETVSRDELVTRWRSLLPGFEATQHFLGPAVALDPSPADQALVGCNVRGYHHLAGQTWMVAGWYTLALSGTEQGALRIAGIDLAMSYETGNRELVARAQDRAAR